MSTVLASLTFFAVLVTKLVDLVRNTVDPGVRLPKLVWNVSAFALGIAVAFLWGLNALATISHTTAQAWAGKLVTGFAIGGGSSGWHELFDLFSSHAKANRPVRNP